MAAIAAAPTAAADQPTHSLLDAVVTREQRCLDREQVAAQIGSWLHRDAIDARITVVVARTADGAGASFEIRRDGAAIAEREFPRLPEECHEMRAALGLGIALAIDATILQTLGIAETTASPVPVIAAPPAPVAIATDPRRAQSRRTSVAVVFEALLLAEVVPRVTWGAYAGIAVDLHGGDFTVRLGALTTGLGETALGSGSAQSRLTAARLDGCVRRTPGPQWFEVRGCLGAGVGAVTAQGRGFETSYRVELPWAALVGRVAAALLLGHGLRLEIGGDAWVPFVVPSLTVVGSDGAVLSELPFAPVAAGAHLALVFIFL